MIDVPEIHYARNGDVHLAYQVFGEGDRDLVFYFNIAHHLSDEDNRAVFCRVLDCLCADGHFVIRGVPSSGRESGDAVAAGIGGR